MNQLGSELILKSGDLFAHRRLTDSTFLCNSREAPFFGYTERVKRSVAFTSTFLPSNQRKRGRALLILSALFGALNLSGLCPIRTYRVKSSTGCATS